MRKKKRGLLLCLLLTAILAIGLLTGCGTASQENASALQTVVSDSYEEDTGAQDEDESAELVLYDEDDQDEVYAEDDEWENGQEDGEEKADTEESSETAAIDEDGSYTTKEDVALYLHIYGKLPSNFITKKEAEKLGWSGGSLEPYAPGKCIGGNYFGNYEGLLPDGNYKECDIDTLGKKKRGAKRIIYSDDGRIYYTDDHYESFTQLY